MSKFPYLNDRHDGDDQESASGQQVHFDQAAHSGDLKMTSKFEKLKNRLQRKVIKRQRPSKRKKSGSSPFLDPSQRHSSVDMNGEEGRKIRCLNRLVWSVNRADFFLMFYTFFTFGNLLLDLLN